MRASPARRLQLALRVAMSQGDLRGVQIALAALREHQRKQRERNSRRQSAA